MVGWYPEKEVDSCMGQQSTVWTYDNQSGWVNQLYVKKNYKYFILFDGDVDIHSLQQILHGKRQISRSHDGWWTYLLQSYNKSIRRCTFKDKHS